MRAHKPILPAKAVEHVEGSGLLEAGKILADFAAAGLIKSYALAHTTMRLGQPSETIRDAAIPAQIWQRIVEEGKVAAALNSGTVRLIGSGLIGGTPEVQLTGISFSESSLSKVLSRYCAAAGSSTPISNPVLSKNLPPNPADEPSIDATAAHKSKLFSPILPGDLVASVAQAMHVTGLGRTKINELMKDGTLVRKKIGRRTLITIESINRLIGGRE